MNARLNADWLKEPLPLAKLYDLGKFFFTASTATYAFIAGVAKINPATKWEWQLITASIALLIATILCVTMVICAAPHLKEKPEREQSAWTRKSVTAWFAFWTVGAVLGIWGVLRGGA